MRLLSAWSLLHPHHRHDPIQEQRQQQHKALGGGCSRGQALQHTQLRREWSWQPSETEPTSNIHEQVGSVSWKQFKTFLMHTGKGPRPTDRGYGRTRRRGLTPNSWDTVRPERMMSRGSLRRPTGRSTQPPSRALVHLVWRPNEAATRQASVVKARHFGEPYRERHRMRRLRRARPDEKCRTRPHE